MSSRLLAYGEGGEIPFSLSLQSQRHPELVSGSDLICCHGEPAYPEHGRREPSLCFVARIEN